MSTARSTIIGTAVAIALFGRNDLARSQDAGAARPPKQNSNVLEEVVVHGIRASLEQSIETKRNSDSIVDAITAEDVGKFPDKNVAEALQRVPGVVVNREFGEGERVSVRGTPRNLTRTLYNGHGLATADWFILDQLNATRTFNFLMLPSDLIGQVSVFKSPQADFEEGGIGGTINVVTRKPLDMKAFTAFASIEAAHSDLANKTDPQASAFVSWKSSADTFGVLLAGVYQERNTRRDGGEVLGYSTHATTYGSVLVPDLIGTPIFRQDRVRKGGNFAVQWKPNDQVDFNLTGLYSRFGADNLNENFMAWGVRALNDGGTLTNATIVNNTAVAGRIASPANGTSGFGVVYDAIDRKAHAQTRNLDLDSNFRFPGDWSLHFQVGYTDAEGNTDAQPFVEFGAPAAFTYDLRGRTPQVQFENINPANPASLDLIFGSLHQILNNDKERYAYADALKELSIGPLKSIKFGAKVTNHDRDLVFNATTYGGFFIPMHTTGCGGGLCTAANFAGGLTPSNFLSEIASPGSLRSYWEVNPKNVENILFSAFAKTAGRIPYPQQEFSVNEKSTAGYVMGNLQGQGWRGNVGVRFVRTQQTSSGALVRPGGAVQNAFGNFDPTTVERTYTDFLPSLNLAYDLTSDTVLRFAASRAMTRPDFTDIAPRTSLNLGALSGQAGNPNVDPYRADQADVALEWYPNKNTLFAVDVFYKKIKSFITDQPATGIFPVQTGTPSAVCTPTSTVDIFNCPFTINQRSNGGGGSIKGAELDVMQPIWGGFGLQANYTYSDGSADNGQRLPDNSKNTYNLAVFFENARVSARLAYTYRSEFLVSFDRSTELNQDALKSLDASVGVNITDHIALTLNAVNITDAKIVQFANDKSQPRAIYDNGRIYFAGVRLKL